MLSKMRAGLVGVICCALTLPVLARSRDAGGGRYDRQIQQEVTAELKKHDWAKEVRATTEDGVVTLSGTVPLYMHKARAYQKIHNKDHVQGVRNRIVVAGPTVPDEQLAGQLADKLRYDRVDQGITFNAFSLSVKNGVVTVSGSARTPMDAESALVIVQSTPGVKDVVDNITILPTSQMDDELRIRVARAVYGAPQLNRYASDPQAPIRIVVKNGHVTLYGVVDSQSDKTVADLQAKSVSGVFSVTNKLMVAGDQPK